MKTIKISLFLVCIFLFLLFSSTAFAVPDDSILSQHIKEADGTTGQDTNTGSGIKTGHIQNGAVTPDKIGFYKNVIIVAPSGGDFTNPVDAMNGITDASASNPYLVKIMPGVYNVDISSVQMKPYVDVEGSGESITKIVGSVDGGVLGATGVINGASNAEIRYLTVENTGGGNYSIAICNYSTSMNYNTSPKISHITAIASGGTWNYGIRNGGSILRNNDTIVIKDTIVYVSGGISEGIYNTSNSSATIDNVKINISNAPGGAIGIENYSNPNITSPIIISNTSTSITNSGSSTGIYTFGTPLIVSNTNITIASSISTQHYGMYISSDSTSIMRTMVKVSGGDAIGIRIAGSPTPKMENVMVEAVNGKALQLIANAAVLIYQGMFKGTIAMDGYYGNGAVLNAAGSQFDGQLNLGLGGTTFKCIYCFDSNFNPI